MRLGQTSAIYVLAKLATSVVGFFATIYFTRTLGEEIYGFYAITIALVSWLGLVKSVGFGEAVVKRMSEGDEPDAYLVAGAAIMSVLTVVVALGVILFRAPINGYVGQPVAEFVVLLLVVTVFSTFVNVALNGSHRVHVYAPLGTLKKTAQSLAMVALVFVGWELTGLLVGHAVGTAVMAALGLYIVRPTFVVPRWRHVVRLVDFAKYAWIGKMQKRTFSHADILILAAFVPAGLTGIYAIAYSLSKFLEIFGSAIKTTLFPEMSKLSAENDMNMIATLTDDALTFSGLFLVPGIVGAAILGDRLLLIYGPNFDAGHWILVILLVGLLVYTYARQLLNTLNAIDRPDLAFRANGVFIGANVVLNVALIYAIGWFGAAIATALSAAIGFLLSLYYLREFIDVRLPIDELARQWIAALIMGLVIYVTRLTTELHWIASYNEIYVVGLVGLGAGVYFLTLVGISIRFRATVSRNLPFDVPLARN